MTYAGTLKFNRGMRVLCRTKIHTCLLTWSPRRDIANHEEEVRVSRIILMFLEQDNLSNRLMPKLPLMCHQQVSGTNSIWST